MNRTILVIWASLLLAGCGSNKGYKLRGTIRDLPDTVIYLQQRIDKAFVSVDSVKTDEGNFEFSGKVDIPDVYYLGVPGRRVRSMFFLENSKVTLNVHADSLSNPDVKGSSVHDEYLVFTAGIDAIYEKLDALWEEYRNALTRGDTAIASELKNQMEAVYKTVSETQMDFLDANPSSYLAPFVVQSLHYGKEAEEVEGLLSRLDPSLQSSTLVGSLNRRVEVLRKVAVGQMAPDFTQNDPFGNPVTLSSFRGRYLLIDFWAAWCGPCRRENPNVVAAYNRFHEKGLDILGVSLDVSREAWLQAIASDGLRWAQVSDLKYWSNGAVELYGISSIPSNLLLDPDGRIIAKNLSGEDLHKELARRLIP